MKELISVVITTYKRSNELERAINSVLAQTYKNIEIIVVDDNGKDSEYQKKSELIVSKFYDKCNIKYVANEQNVGGAVSRNNGIENSNGEYIAFLDDDDEYYPEKLEEQLKLFKKGNKELALVYCYTDSYDENNNKLQEYKYDYVGNCLFDSMRICIAATSQWLCDKSKLEKVGNFTNVPCKQDTTVIVKLLSNGYEVDRVPKVLVKYNEHSNGRISGKGLKNIKGEKLLRDYCRSLYNKLNGNQILEVESEFSYKLSKLYAYNNIKDSFNQEMNMLKKLNYKNYIKVLGYYNLLKCKVIRR